MQLPAPSAHPTPQGFAALGVVLSTERILEFEPLVNVMIQGHVSRY